MATIEFFRVIRGVEVKVCADSFDGDPSTGVGFGPEELWAVRLGGDGKDAGDFELADEEIELLSIEATEIYEGDRREDDVSIGFGGADTSNLGTPISELSGRPGEPGWEKFKAIARSWGYD